jgi:hypothetical protein
MCIRPAANNPDWVRDCLLWRKRVLTGKHAHWCDDWDGLPVDETTPEWPCACVSLRVDHAGQ